MACSASTSAISFLSRKIASRARSTCRKPLSTFIATTARSAPILIYCYHGHASRDYAQTFSDFGFTEVYSLNGGFEAWRRRPRQGATTSQNDPLNTWLGAQGFAAGDVDATIANETTPLMKAAQLGNVAIVQGLVAANARLDARNADGNNALWLACVGRHLDVIDLLVEAGINIDNRNDNGATALMYASSSGRADVVAKLLALGADTTPETLDGFTALDVAASLECLALLRRAGRPLRKLESSA